MQYARRFSFGRCLVLLSVYMLGMVLGSAIMLSLDVSRVILEPVRTARDTIPGFSQVSFLLPLARVPLSLSIILSPSPPFDGICMSLFLPCACSLFYLWFSLIKHLFCFLIKLIFASVFSSLLFSCLVFCFFFQYIISILGAFVYYLLVTISFFVLSSVMLAVPSSLRLSLSPSLISLNVIHSFILLYQLCYTN